MKVYLAARYSRHVELEAYADALRFEGHVVTSRWHKGEHQALDADLINDPDLARRFAVEDREDLLDADLCLSFTEHPRSGGSRGGRHVEFGIALQSGMPCWIVGPVENIFHTLPPVRRFETFPEAIAALR